MSDRAVRFVSVALVAVIVLAGVGVTGSTASAQPIDTIADTQVDPDDVSLRVDLRADGSAAWTIEYRVRLDDDNTTRAFESLQDDIAANDTGYVAEFRGRMVATADTAENATGREMAIQNVSIEATQQQLPQEYGVLTYTFVWTNFAVVDGGSIAAGDALTGFVLDTETALQFSWPAGYDAETVRPEPDSLRTEPRVAA
jgi:ABC-type phosphate transport system substrate-binding protein